MHYYYIHRHTFSFFANYATPTAVRALEVLTVLQVGIAHGLSIQIGPAYIRSPIYYLTRGLNRDIGKAGEPFPSG